MTRAGGVPATERLLADVRVVDLGAEPCQIAGRVLADLGADVVKVEPASGDPLRRSPPFDAATGRSLRFWAWNINKRAAATTIDGDGIEDLMAGADIVLASSPEGPGDPARPTPAGSRSRLSA